MEWKVDFRAGMSDWAAEPKAADFDFGLHFLIEWEIDRFSERRFLPLLDHARIPAIFGELQHFWDHAWYIRALPGYLLHLAESTETAVGVQRVFRVDYGDGDERQSIQLTVR